MKSWLSGAFALFLFAPLALAENISWPQEIVAGNGAVVIVYQPQIEEFSGNDLVGRAAISVKKPEADNVPVFGAIWFEAKIDTDREARTATIRDVDIIDVRFAEASDEQKKQLAGFIEDQVEQAHFTISVDQLLADLDAEKAGVAEAELKHNPPKIILSTRPALLVSIDGEPVFEMIDGSRYERVVNTPFLLVRGGKDYYLYIGSNAWYEATSISGAWTRSKRVPDDVASLVEPADDDDTQVDDIQIIIANEELIISDGPPSWAPVEGMNLLYMDNTDSNAFLELSTQSYYVLLSGRWYRGEGLLGDLQWSHVPNDELPEPFGDIPEDSVNGAVLSQVAGTEQARDAVLDNTIPQTAAIKRDDDSFSVEYDGAPDFAPIEDIRVEYAQNTSSAVFRYGNLYYACDNGVWYVSNSATGPWTVATDVPDAIYTIPASNPHHNVTYVRVYDVTPQVVYVGYTPGYYGSYYYRTVLITIRVIRPGVFMSPITHGTAGALASRGPMVRSASPSRAMGMARGGASAAIGRIRARWSTAVIARPTSTSMLITASISAAATGPQTGPIFITVRKHATGLRTDRPYRLIARPGLRTTFRTTC
jgi:hypothetical protein